MACRLSRRATRPSPPRIASSRRHGLVAASRRRHFDRAAHRHPLRLARPDHSQVTRTSMTARPAHRPRPAQGTRLLGQYHPMALASDMIGSCRPQSGLSSQSALYHAGAQAGTNAQRYAGLEDGVDIRWRDLAKAIGLLRRHSVSAELRGKLSIKWTKVTCAPLGYF